MKTLIIHHLELCWESGYKKFGTSFEELIEKFAFHLDSVSYDRIILTRFEESAMGPEYWPIANYVNEVLPYAYGWEATEKEAYPDMFAEGGNHSEVVLIEDWMKIPGEVYISGAFDGECIEDLEIALRHCNVPFSRIEHLIVG